jgi:archaemetzincin
MSVRCCALAFVVLAVALGASRGEAAPSVFYLQPLGPTIPEEDVTAVRSALEELYGLEVKVLPRVPLPREAYYPPRKRYRAEKLLDFLRPRLPPDGARILGLTAVDISTTKGPYSDWGVMGLGEMPGVTGVISSFRCYKRTRSPTNGRERFAKTAVHEIGHTLGLPHCPTKGCLMADAEGSVLSSDQESDLCPRCRDQLRADGRSLPSSPRLPWPPVPGPRRETPSSGTRPAGSAPVDPRR